MCIINRPVHSVNNTLLFGAKLSQPFEVEGKQYERQLTIYSNKVNTKIGNEMILPFPLKDGIPNDLQITLYDLSHMRQNIFKSIDVLFTRTNRPRSKKSKATLGLDRALPVILIGSYQVTICYCIEDLKRIDPEVFQLADGVETLLTKEYPTNFGFLICKLDPTKNNDSKEYEPFAYSSFMVKPSQLFLPTLHFHAEEINDKKLSSTKSSSSMDGLWDHKIFVYNYHEGLPKIDEWAWNGRLSPTISDLEVITGSFDSCTSFAKSCIQGNSFPNQDLWISVN